MSWLSVSFEADADRVELLTDALLAAGALAADVGDAAAGAPQEQPIFGEPGAETGRRWQRSRVTALFPANIELSAALVQAFRAAGIAETTPYRVDRVDDQDWVRVTQSQFTPQQISQRLWIVPSWHTAPDPGAINIVLDPGLAFGTGTHPTTRLCLRWLDRHIRGGESVLDFGCGSGILAIAALKLGAAAARGVDVDEQALLAARHNAMQNQVTAGFFDAADKLGRPAQIVVANILANPLRVLAPLLAKLTEKHGRVVLAGILEEQADEVREAYRPWFEMDTTEREEGWVLLSGVKA
ncbi:MAG: 50S ribosomal protein L11 methyltransferase [Burkholderiales bacterium]|nr:50S ribosomal protein L11 methyltransferase [Burkholderiales bacterium]